MDKKELAIFAAQIRLTTLEEFAHYGGGHIGGAMSLVETLAALYGGQLAHKPEEPDWSERDRLVLSKGHAGPVLYAALALRGFFDVEMLKTLNKPGTNLPSHCDARKTPGVDMTTGSLGQGLSCGVGIALGRRMDELDYVTYVIVGDGEMDEGQNWEALMSAAHFGLDHLIIFCDRNKKQLDGYTRDIMELGRLKEKFEAFGCHVQEVDGHAVSDIDAAIACAKQVKNAPAVIILDTVKGKGCTFSETVENNHHQFFTAEEMDLAIKAAEKALEKAKGGGTSCV